MQWQFGHSRCANESIIIVLSKCHNFTLVTLRSLPSSDATLPLVTQPLLKARNLLSRHATSYQGTQPLCKSRNLSSNTATSPQVAEPLLKSTQPLFNSCKPSLSPINLSTNTITKKCTIIINSINNMNNVCISFEYLNEFLPPASIPKL